MGNRGEAYVVCFVGLRSLLPFRKFLSGFDDDGFDNERDGVLNLARGGSRHEDGERRLHGVRARELLGGFLGHETVVYDGLAVEFVDTEIYGFRRRDGAVEQSPNGLL